MPGVTLRIGSIPHFSKLHTWKTVCPIPCPGWKQEFHAEPTPTSCTVEVHGDAGFLRHQSSGTRPQLLQVCGGSATPIEGCLRISTCASSETPCRRSAKNSRPACECEGRIACNSCRTALLAGLNLHPICHRIRPKYIPVANQWLLIRQINDNCMPSSLLSTKQRLSWVRSLPNTNPGVHISRIS